MGHWVHEWNVANIPQFDSRANFKKPSSKSDSWWRFSYNGLGRHSASELKDWEENDQKTTLKIPTNLAQFCERILKWKGRTQNEVGLGWGIIDCCQKS